MQLATTLPATSSSPTGTIPFLPFQLQSLQFKFKPAATTASCTSSTTIINSNQQLTVVISHWPCNSSATIPIHRTCKATSSKQLQFKTVALLCQHPTQPSSSSNPNSHHLAFLLSLAAVTTTVLKLPQSSVINHHLQFQQPSTTSPSHSIKIPNHRELLNPWQPNQAAASFPSSSQTTQPPITQSNSQPSHQTVHSVRASPTNHTFPIHGFTSLLRPYPRG